MVRLLCSKGARSVERISKDTEGDDGHLLCASHGLPMEDAASLSACSQYASRPFSGVAEGRRVWAPVAGWCADVR